MKHDRTIRGAAAVGALSELPPWEAEFILNLRIYMDGQEGREEVARLYSSALGAQGLDEFQAFESLLYSIHANMLRPFVRHEVNCACVGSDEAVLTNLVRMATEGELHEAAMIATLMVRPAHAERIAILAAQVGTAAKELSFRPNQRACRPDGQPLRLH